MVRNLAGIVASITGRRHSSRRLSKVAAKELDTDLEMSILWDLSMLADPEMSFLARFEWIIKHTALTDVEVANWLTGSPLKDALLSSRDKDGPEETGPEGGPSLGVAASALGVSFSIPRVHRGTEGN